MRRLLFTILALSAALPDALAALQAGVDRTVVQEGETLQLVLEGDEAFSGTPDLSPLEKDFDIVGRSQSSSMRIVNGVRSSSTQWQLTLAPKRTGVLEIPPIRDGNAATPGIKVEVKPAAEAAPTTGAQAPELFLEVEATPQTPYVQQQITYTVRLFQGVDLREAALSEPKSASAAVEPLGEPVVYDAERHGRRYRVTEKRYALFPQSSGGLLLPGPLFRGGVPERSRRLLPNDLLGGGLIEQFLATTRTVNLRGRELNLAVRPAPDAASGTWLPAKSVRLSESWSPDPPEFRVGEPVTRTVSISALGVSPSQLPELPDTGLPQVQLYPDQPHLESQVAATDLLGIRRQKFALVPTTEGTFTLPEIRLPWWDTTSDQPQVATLPARTLTVGPGRVGSTPPRTPVPAPAVSAPAPGAASSPTIPAPTPGAAPSSTPAVSAPSSAVSAPASTPTAWGGWLAGMLLAGWAATAGAWYLERRRRIPLASPPVPLAAPPPAGPPAKELREACGRNDPQTVRDLLLAWAAHHWPETPPRSLPQLATRLTDPAATQALAELDRALYAQNGASWQGAGCAERLLSALESPSPSTSPQGGLPPLHPA